MQSPESTEPRLDRGVSLLEKSVQFRFGSLVLSFILGTDVALHFAGYPPIGELRLGGEAHAVPIGDVLVFVGAFVVGMSAIAPAVSTLVRFLVGALGMTRRTELRFEELHLHGHVLLGDAKKVALLEKDAFWIKRIDDKTARHEKEEEEARTTATISFACAALLLVDGFLASGGTIVLNGLASVGRFGLGEALQVGLVCLASWLLAQPWLSWLRRDPYPTRTIHHPQLAKQRADEATQRKGGPAYRRAGARSLTRPQADRDIVS
jgi:hypothetical protein